ncbi:MAG: VWA domain-containing protein [Myxococcales bacterium]|nr:VWA domain-containing protein [Myxococcales bacterium]
MKTRRTLTYGLFALASLLIALAAGAMPHRPGAPPMPPPVPLIIDSPPVVLHTLPPPPPIVEAPPPLPKPPRVEVVFALDTTGSMDGLIEGAKRKVWNIANFISQAQPKPEVRIGLVGYRDIGDAYVTRFYDLSDDMDTVFRHLNSFRAEGGGDTPEHVAKALHDAIDRSSWSKGENVVRLVYLVGDAAPHTDYQDGYDYRAISRRATRMGIHVNTILCGHDSDARVAWNEISRAGGGAFASIAQSGGMATVTTPYDAKLADLNRRLAGTALGWGVHRGEIATKAAAAAAAPASIAADRAGYSAGNNEAVSGEGELLNDLAKGRAKLGAIPVASLPKPMQAMSPAEQGRFVAEKDAERKQIIEEINGISRQRSLHLKADAKKSKREAGFDDKVRDSIEAAAPALAF